MSKIVNNLENKLVKITQIGSSIGRHFNQEANLKGLGLNKMNKTVFLKDTPDMRGMINKVKHLVKVEEVTNDK